MFNLDNWQEIFETIRKNKVRTFLTSLSVASGIFILVLLLGFSQGMQNGIRQEFENDATNVIYVWSDITTLEYKGLNPGRRIEFNNGNYDYITSVYKNKLEYQSGQNQRWGTTITYKQESGAYSLQGVYPDMQHIEKQSMFEGRYINNEDIRLTNKVAVISKKIQNELLKGVEEPLKEYIQIGGTNFQIVGVFSDAAGEREENKVYIPISTLQKVFNGSDKLGNLSFTLKPGKDLETSVEESKQFTEDLKKYLKAAHSVAPEDNRGVGVFSAIEEMQRFYTLTNSMALFFWFVGICTIIAGVVGVSNIMLIVVKERTREIGIRKAIGARPWTIISMILHESIFVTTIAGFTGLIFGMLLLEVLGPNIQIDYISNPSVNFSMALTMVIVLVVAGAIAGFIPAYRAAHIKPIAALKDE
ncbi:MAG: ABC transporter permease [Flavobacteriaceae bacterium]|nr:ABC transporter permease [Flavobacteriaceae bacterium]